MAEALSAAGYLRRTARGYTATATARTWLLKDSPRSLYHLVLYVETLHGRWQQLEHALEHGAPVRPYYEGFGPDDWRLYALAMQDLARLLLPRVARRLRLPRSGGSLLDVGAPDGEPSGAG